ncbi:nucleotidyltransferase domain-containing protein [uncultured Megasphaera sp.]|uniref:nucleotidyltransferase domain-containing protein n=1 Tax=uncultured Megasphaera sp. TaxID=165188 RepID=UPI00262DA6D1|nr:nucleotidyltransferase domain-containing protein [uncultured Megasphaera sp.]
MSDYERDRGTKRKLEGVIHDMIAAYREVFGSEINQILLYGSYARGDADGESDIDIAAIVHGDRQELQDKLKKGLGRFFGFGINIWSDYFTNGHPL